MNLEALHSLSKLTDLQNLMHIGGGLNLSDNKSLINFTGLENISSLGSPFYISDNESLTNFTGLLKREICQPESIAIPG